jgi:glutamine amidotransferase
MPRVALVDYGAGNLTSVAKALRAVGAEVYVPSAPEEMSSAAAIVIPGVGHYGATRALGEPWRMALRDAAAAGRAMLGICLGYQWLFDSSSEDVGTPGLGLLNGKCTRLDVTDGLKIPHVGWNALQVLRASELLAGVPDGSQAYFTHSYAVPIGPDSVASTTHGATFASASVSGSVWGVQFHPEKSGDVGLTVLANFVRVARSC